MLFAALMDALEKLIDACRAASGGPDRMPAVRSEVAAADLDAVLAAVRGRPEPWFFAAATDLTVFATAGRPGSGSAPHDHGLWAVIACLEGAEGSRRYEERDGVLVETSVGRLGPGEVHALPAEAIHAVFNCWSEANVMLHIYGGDFLAARKRVWDPISGACSELALVEPLAPAGDR